jgi:hypothetical protein
MAKLKSGHECVHLYWDNVKLQNISVTLTFEEGTWFLEARQCCHVIIICAKLFQNLSMHDKVTVWTWLLCKWKRTDGQRDISFSQDTLSWCGRHLCQVILKSLDAWQSYSPDTNVCTINSCDNVKLQNVSVTLTFEVRTWFFDASHCLDVVDIWAKLFQNPSMYDKVTIRARMKWGGTDRQMVLL